MRAVVVDEFGGPEVLRVADLPAGEPGPGEVAVRVTAAAVNPVDLMTRSGMLAAMLPAGGRAPWVLGWDLAGTVEAVGPGVHDIPPGAAVVAMSDWFDAGVGVQAEQVVLPARLLAPAPAGVAPEAAATLPLNAMTAVQALDLLDLPAGSTLLVTGAAGGVGGYAVELAAARGLHVLAQVGTADADLVLGLGAAGVVDRGGDPVAAARAAAPGGVDGLLDAAVAGPHLIGAVRDGGAFVAVIDPALPAPERGVRTAKVSVRGDGVQLGELVRLVEQGRLSLRVAGVLPFAEAAEAHRQLEKGGVRGRLVLVP